MLKSTRIPRFSQLKSYPRFNIRNRRPVQRLSNIKSNNHLWFGRFASFNGTRFTRCSDKCISAGEGAQVFAKDVKFKDCNVGIAVKDSSTFDLDRGVFNNCQIGWNAYNKKWRWAQGGKGKIMNTSFYNSKIADIKGDKLSFIEIAKNGSQSLKIMGKIKVKINSQK